MMNIAQRDRILASVNQVIGRKESVVPNTPENNSHDRLLRISAGLLHLLNEVLPGMANTAERDEIAVWVDAMYSITMIEALDAKSLPPQQCQTCAVKCLCRLVVMPQPRCVMRQNCRRCGSFILMLACGLPILKLAPDYGR